MNPGGEYPGPLADRRDDRVPQLRVPLSGVLGLDDQVQLLRPERFVVDPTATTPPTRTPGTVSAARSKSAGK